MLELTSNYSLIFILVPVISAVAFIFLYVFKYTPTRRATPPITDESQYKVRSIKHVTVIINPNSGNGSAEKIFNTIEPTLKNAGLIMTVVETTDKGHAYRIANQVSQQECDGLICVGGNGLVHEVVNGLLNRSDATIARHIPIGIVPAGTTNGLAHSLQIFTPQDAALRIIQSRVRPLDIMGLLPIIHPSQQPTISHSTLYSAFSLDWGISSEVEALSERFSWMRGFKTHAAVLTKLITSITLPSYVATLSFLPAPTSTTNQLPCDPQHPNCEACEKPMQSVKGKRPDTDLKGWVIVDGIINNLAFFVASNTASGLTPRAHLSDGYMDLAIVERCSRLELANLLLTRGKPPKTLPPGHTRPNANATHEPELKNVRYYKTAQFRVDIDRSIPLTIDGELLEPPESSEPFRLNVEVNRGLCLIIC